MFDIFSNGTLWETLDLTVLHDYHEESGPPQGYSFNFQNSSAKESGGESNDGLLNVSILLLFAFGVAFLARGPKDA